jgi:ribonucleotide monophosphatase NagD (HAD superfamily)
MARAAGALGILVLTGATTADEARQAEPPPAIVVSSVGELASMLVRMR